MTPIPLGDSALVLAFGTTVDDAMRARVRAVAEGIRALALPGVVDVVPAFASVAVYHEPIRSGNHATLSAALSAGFHRWNPVEQALAPRLVEIPVHYGGAAGPDLEHVARASEISCDEVVRLHAGADYRVDAIGFAPGFGYLSGLPEKIRVPRRATPRTRVPTGTVGIGGAQTGVYPLESPGGWNLIGRTTLSMFDATRSDASVLQTGDRVKFRPVEEAFVAPSPASDASGGIFAPPSALAPDGAVRVVKPGVLTTIQDLGRTGHRADGVPLSGAADAFALRLANLLVGNAENAAALEFALVGPELYFARDALVALTGGEFTGLPGWHPHRIAAGTTLSLGAATRGCRGYLAVGGGFAVEPVLGSRSTYVRAALGGLHGRALRAGDVLAVGAATREPRGNWHLDARLLPAYAAMTELRVIAGAQADEFGAAFFAAEYRVSPQSDRMGVRLQGTPLGRTAAAAELRSSAVVPGTVQVPPDGQPIVLMADAQTLGGYPQVAHVISADLSLLAQLRPGGAVRFREVTLDEAHRLLLARERAVALLREGLAEKFL